MARLSVPSGLTRRAAFGAAALGVAAPASGATRTNPTESGLVDALSKLDGLVRDAMDRTGVPGMAIAVVSKDAVVYQKGFGVRAAGKTGTVDADTIFQLASVSKPIASTVMAILADRKIVDWDDPIVRHDPGFALHDAWVSRQVTLRDMFCHRSGLPDHAGDTLEEVGYGRTEVLHRMRFIRPGSSFRSHYAYTNFGLSAAAFAAAQAAGRPWEELTAALLYRPLGMHRTSSRYADFAADGNHAVLHMQTDGKWVARATRDADAQSPAGGVSASVRDMTAWLRLQLGGGAIGGTRILGGSALAETHRPQMIREPPRNPATDHVPLYGLGWNIDYDAKGRVRLSHSGAFNIGAATSVILMPGEQLGIVALTNAQPIGVPEAVSRSFLDLALDGRIERDWLALFQQALRVVMAPTYGTSVDYSRKPVAASASLPPAAYAGSYSNDLFGRIEVGTSEVGLVLKLGPKLAPYPLLHFDRDVFTYQPIGENAYGRSGVSFAVGADQTATSVRVENLDINGQGLFLRD